MADDFKRAHTHGAEYTCLCCGIAGDPRSKRIVARIARARLKADLRRRVQDAQQ